MESGTLARSGPGRSLVEALKLLLRRERGACWREALVVWAVVLLAVGAWRLSQAGPREIWRPDPAGWVLLAFALAFPALSYLVARFLPRERILVERLDAELELRGALRAAVDLPLEPERPLPILLQRRIGRRLATPASPALRQRRRERRRRRWGRWALLALLLILLLSLLGAWLGPRGPLAKGREGELAGPTPRTAGIGTAGATGSDTAAEGERAPEPGAPQEQGTDEPEPDSQPEREDEEEAPGPEIGEVPPPEPPELVEDLLVRLQERARSGPERELMVLPVPTGGSEGAGSAGAAGGVGAEGSRAEELRPAGLEELLRAAERPLVPEALGARERSWIEAYFAEIRKL